MKLSRIVCATDFSEASQATLVQAAALAEYERAELHVISVGSDTNSAHGADPRAGGASHSEITTPQRGEHGVVLERRTRNAAQAIVHAAHAIRADLVVVGTTVAHAGASGRGWLAEAVAYEAHCPTLIVPSELAPTPGHLPFRKILCPVDFSPGSVVGLEKALYLAQRSEGVLTLVHVIEAEEEGAMQTRWNPPPDESLRGGNALYRMWSSIPNDVLNWCKIDARVTAGPAPARIVATAYSVNADLIVMGVAARGLRGGLNVGSTLRGVAADSTCPILVPRAPIDAAASDREYVSHAIWNQRRAALSSSPTATCPRRNRFTGPYPCVPSTIRSHVLVDLQHIGGVEPDVAMATKPRLRSRRKPSATQRVPLSDQASSFTEAGTTMTGMVLEHKVR